MAFTIGDAMMRRCNLEVVSVVFVYAYLQTVCMYTCLKGREKVRREERRGRDNI